MSDRQETDKHDRCNGKGTIFDRFGCIVSCAENDNEDDGKHHKERPCDSRDSEILGFQEHDERVNNGRR